MIFTYHKIGQQFELGITTVRKQTFGAHLDFLSGLGLEFVTASEADTAYRPVRQVAITFDDGYESVYSDACLEMEPRGIGGTVFPVVGSIDGYNKWDVQLSRRPFKHLSWPQLRELSAGGFEVGSHTLSHRDLTRLDPKTLRRELGESRAMLEEHLGTGVTAISYPFGRFSARVIEEALEAGYTHGFTSFPHDATDPMAIGRMTVYSVDGTSSLKRKLGLAPGYRFECLKNKFIARLSLGTTLVKR
ncbi:MAG: polysaccharide deacetylase family protein [Candidatus Eisenbacteria bacterium]